MKRRWIFWALIIVFIWVVFTRFTEIEGLAFILAQGKWGWVLVAAICQVFYYIAFAATYQAAFSTVEIERRIRDLVPVTLGALFVNVAAPLGGAAGTALFVDDATRHGFSGGRATAGSLLQQVSEFVAFTLVLAIGLIYLFFQNDLKSYQIIGAITLLIIIIALCGVLLLGLFQPLFLRRLLGWAEHFTNTLSNKIRKKPLFAEGWAEKNATDFSQAAEAIKRHPDRLARTLGVALAAHIIDIVSLYAVIRAFYQPISIGALIAGYSIGILFWLVTITPQGIGVVEGVMALVFTSLNIPGGVATTISLAFRGLTFWLPLGLGFLLLRRVKSFGMGERSLAGDWTVRIIAILAVAVGIMDLIAGITPPHISPITIFSYTLPLWSQDAGYLITSLAGFGLLLLSGGLWRRKRLAWFFSVVLLFLSVISYLIKGLNYQEALLCGVLATWLLFLKFHFHARSDIPSFRQGLHILTLAIVFSLSYGVIGFLLIGNQLPERFTLLQAVQQTLSMFVKFYNNGFQPTTHFTSYFALSIYLVSAVTLGYALVSIIRPFVFRQPATTAERERARGIVEHYGNTALARLTLLEDKSYYFSPRGSVIAFVAKGRAAVALGDPIGPVEDVPEAISGFRKFCEKIDLQPAFYQVLPDHLSDYQFAQFDVLHIGNEGVIALQEFSQYGKAGKTIKSPYNRFIQLGYQAILHKPPLSDELLNDLQSISDEWLLMMHGSEKQFSVGWFDDNYIRNCPVMCIHIPDGPISAFANIIPEYNRNEATIDLLRHRGELEKGSLEFLFNSLFLWAKAEGYASFNIGLSPLSDAGRAPQEPITERALDFLEQHINQFDHFRELHEKKAKFHPDWSPRYLVYPGQASLPAVTFTILRTNSGDSRIQSYFHNLFHKEYLLNLLRFLRSLNL